MSNNALANEEAIELLHELVAIPSPSRHEGRAAEWLVAWMAERGFSAAVDEGGNAVGSRGEGPHTILLLSHIDTFPGELPVRLEDGWLLGRGSVDAKGSLCTFAAAAARATVQPGWRIVVVGAVEEEAPTSRGARHVLATWPAPDHCIIGEPSGWDRVTLGYKGALQARLNWVAGYSHSAGPAKLPAEQAVDFWNAVDAYCRSYNQDTSGAFDRLDPSLRHIAIHDRGAVADVEMQLGFRLPPVLTPGQARDVVSRLVREELPGRKVDLVFEGGEVAFRAPKNSALVRAFLGAIRGQEGAPRFVVKTGTSDMNVVGPSWGESIVAYGPGDSALDHTPEERLAIDEYFRAIDVLTSVLETVQRSSK